MIIKKIVLLVIVTLSQSCKLLYNNDMSSFEIKDTFLLNGKPFQIISGSIHYFRVVPEYWQDRLEKLKNMGCNTVETYIPWNITEPKKGEFCFDGLCNF